MSYTIFGVVTNGVIVPNALLPEGTRVEIRPIPAEAPIANPLLQFSGHLDPDDPIEKEFVEELARGRREDLEQTLLEDRRECSDSSLTPTT